MTLLSRNRGAVGLVLGAAFLLANACGSSDKKSVQTPGDAGAAGAPEAGAVAGGAAGAAEPPSAGEGGSAGQTTSDAGAGGDSAAGAGGESGGGPLACAPSGIASGLTITAEPIYQACRGALIVAQANAGARTSTDFTCCAAHAVNDGFSAEVLGFFSGEDTTAQLTFVVPDDAPLGSQALALTCSEGPAENTIALNVRDGLAPVVDSVTAQLEAYQDMTVEGSGLLGVTDIKGVSDSGGVYDCAIHPSAQSDDKLVCDFGGDIPKGDYSLVVYNSNCGFALASPPFKILPTL